MWALGIPLDGSSEINPAMMRRRVQARSTLTPRIESKMESRNAGSDSALPSGTGFLVLEPRRSIEDDDRYGRDHPHHALSWHGGHGEAHGRNRGGSHARGQHRRTIRFGWMADVYDKRCVMVAAYALMAAGLLAFTQAHLGWLIFLFLALFSPGFGGTMIIRGAMLREYFGAGSFGKLLGITMGMASLGGMLGPPSRVGLRHMGDLSAHLVCLLRSHHRFHCLHLHDPPSLTRVTHSAEPSERSRARPLSRRHPESHRDADRRVRIPRSSPGLTPPPRGHSV